MLEACGRTTDGRTVVRGMYRFYETSGVPLDVILEFIRDRGAVPDWRAFVDEAVAAGMSEARAVSKLEEAVADTFGPGMREAVTSRLRSGK